MHRELDDALGLADATAEGIENWSLTWLRERLIKTGARVLLHPP